VSRSNGLSEIRRQMSARMRVVCAMIAVATLLATTPHAAPAVKLPRLGGVDELKTWFNAGQGYPRLIFLLSPT
jgi:hypothetical protein